MEDADEFLDCMPGIGEEAEDGEYLEVPAGDEYLMSQLLAGCEMEDRVWLSDEWPDLRGAHPLPVPHPIANASVGLGIWP